MGLCNSNMLLLGSSICLIKNGLLELVCMCDSNVDYYNFEHLYYTNLITNLIYTNINYI